VGLSAGRLANYPHPSQRRHRCEANVTGCGEVAHSREATLRASRSSCDVEKGNGGAFLSLAPGLCPRSLDGNYGPRFGFPMTWWVSPALVRLSARERTCAENARDYVHPNIPRYQCLHAGQSQRSGHFHGENRSSRLSLRPRTWWMPVGRQRFPATPSIPIGERTPRSAASGNAHFAVAWMRGIGRTSEPCEQRMIQRLGNTEARLKQTLRRRTEQTASNARG